MMIGTMKILKSIKDSISKNLKRFEMMSGEEIFNERKNKFLKIGRSKGFIDNTSDLIDIKNKDNYLFKTFKNYKNIILVSALILITFIFLIIFL